jgi:hypothetical protein
MVLVNVWYVWFVLVKRFDFGEKWSFHHRLVCLFDRPLPYGCTRTIRYPGITRKRGSQTGPTSSATACCLRRRAVRMCHAFFQYILVRSRYQQQVMQHV